MFSRNRPVLDFMVGSLGDNVHQCRRNNKISFKNRLIKYPFENDLASLPLEDNYECLRDFVYNAHQARYPDPANLREWLLARFGTSICEKYLFPYTEKVWNVPVEELSMLWADRIPTPDPDDLLRSALGYPTEGYLHQLHYHYPLRGGYQAISEAWAEGLDVAYGFEVASIERTAAGTLAVSDDASTREYDRLVSTMPLPELVKVARFEIPERVREAVAGLRINPMLVVSLGIRGEDPDEYTAIYFPEPDFLVNRISFPRTFSPHNAPDGTYSIQAEITCDPADPIWRASDEYAVDHVVSGLVSRGIVPSPDDVILRDVARARYAYVVYDVGYERRVETVRDWFREQGIELVGRFSFFEYVNVDGALERALDVAGRLNGAPVRLEQVAGTR
jgi:protoporphyrinogen oxidase